MEQPRDSHDHWHSRCSCLQRGMRRIAMCMLVAHLPRQRLIIVALFIVMA